MKILDRSIGPKKHPSQSKTALTFKAKAMAKRSECNYSGATPSHPKEKCRTFLIKYKCRKCGKEGHEARKCLSKPQNVNALDDPVSDDGQET